MKSLKTLLDQLNNHSQGAYIRHNCTIFRDDTLFILGTISGVAITHSAYSPYFSYSWLVEDDDFWHLVSSPETLSTTWLKDFQRVCLAVANLDDIDAAFKDFPLVQFQQPIETPNCEDENS